MSETFTAAQAYARAGWSVFPLWWIGDGGACACPDGASCASPGKHPRTVHGVRDASRSVVQVARWWAAWPQANVGLPAHDNGLAILDVDPKSGGDASLRTLVQWAYDRLDLDLLRTLTVLTGSGGTHLYYAAPPGGIKSAARSFGADGLDTRGRGGYVVAPPSLHASGERYEWVDPEVPLAPWPAVLSRLMEPRRPAASAAASSASTRRPTTNGGAWATAALRGEVEQVAGTPEGGGPAGGRNAQLNVSAYKLGRIIGGGHLDEAEVAEALLDAALRCGLGEGEARKTIASGLTAGRARPRGPRAAA